MASLRAHQSSIPFTLPLDASGFVLVYKSLVSLKFSFCMGTIHIEQEFISEIGLLFETVLVPKSQDNVGCYCSLQAGSDKS